MEKLISVIIPTWNRAKPLTEVCLPSLLNQTYKNIEIVVVGDGCIDDTEERIAALKESRITFKNLDEREELSPRERLNGLGGFLAGDTAHDMCNGEWISWSNDCDIHFPCQLETCLNFATENNYDMVGGGAGIESYPGQWAFYYSFVHTTWLYKEHLRSYRFSEKGLFDSAILYRMRKAKVPMGRINEIFALMPLRPGQLNRACKYRIAYENMVKEIGVKETMENVKKCNIKRRSWHDENV